MLRNIAYRNDYGGVPCKESREVWKGVPDVRSALDAKELASCLRKPALLTALFGNKALILELAEHT